ncbi:MAG TPA: alpha/beta fold hydrolase [Polyangiaceae bacterium LLY-WYZ-15_(1-7)]|nr:alpha/beta fold hydrolase [Polyangiaceae bacterium LLY-WYZ-15_(1-7)]HJL03814.1 alpha/beta fold hydrolase [Polyangiaceae bacterium LLY-WYZ-15_(1-7)]HJL07550.1 alpha/beta fold hydrolase [Polyangiaceae bacterium LLY-WYZ-15_(1-7)]HJL21781.1 alpha/beta fold hydrolase [Polyangiaceae bacterium LLY-WYZ-15_(1-7)]HJL38763.1 alpha/beta fold hydrolase [Polyangiaceae bacterium LLY-WYZ-15_(1-7)]
MSETLFVVGSTGLLGDAVVREALARGWRVMPLVRNLEARRAALGARWPGAEPVAGDVMAPGLGLADGDRRHLAAVSLSIDCFGRFAFGLDDAQARVNVDGAVATVRVVATLPGLRAHGHVGGYRVADGTEGDGAYERSKREAVRQVAAQAEALGVPLTQLHPATVLGDSRTGETSQTTGLGDTFRRLWERRLPARVGGRDTWVPVVFADDFARLALAALEDRAGRDETTAHWILDEATPRLPELLETLARVAGVDAPTRSVPVGLVRALPARWTGVEKETLGFLDARTYPTESARALREAHGIATPDLSAGLSRWASHLVATGFSAEPAARGRFVGGTFVGELGAPGDRLLLHGLPLEHGSWAPLVDALGRGAWAPDLPGLGRSGGAGRDLDGAWLEEILDGLGLEAATIVAHSLACAPALELAATRPERVRALILLSPFFLQRRAGALGRCPALAGPALKRMSSERLGAALFRRPDVRVVARTRAALARRGVAREAARRLAQASRMDERARLRALLERVSREWGPVTLVVGEHDPLEVAGKAESIAGAGHAPQVDAPEAVAAVVRAAVV